MGTSKHSKLRKGSNLPKVNGLRHSERRRTFQRHLQSWAYDHVKRCGDFEGWIAPALDSKSYALSQPVTCFVKAAAGDGKQETRIHLKLFKRRAPTSTPDRRHAGTRRSRPTSRSLPTKSLSEPFSQDTGYYAMVKAGPNWVTDKEWFANMMAHSRIRHGQVTRLPYRLRSDTVATAEAQQPNKSSLTPLPAYSIAAHEWLRLGPPLRLLELPREVRFQILDYVLQLPDVLLFDGERQSIVAREKPRQASSLRDFRSCSLVPSRQLNSEVNHLLYSTTTFAFHSAGTLLEFLTNIGNANRAFVRKIRLQFSYYEYFDLFTPDWLIDMLDVPVWSRTRTILRSFLSAMQLEQLTVRLKDDAKSHSRPPHQGSDPFLVRGLTSLDNPWVQRSVLAFCPGARFESATWPHRDPVQGVHWSWDSLIHAALDHPAGSSIGLWLDRTPKSLFLREQRQKHSRPNWLDYDWEACFGGCRGGDGLRTQNGCRCRGDVS